MIAITALHGIEIQGPLGRGIQIIDDMYVTNDRDVIKHMIPAEVAQAMGNNEYLDLLDRHHAVYSRNVPQTADDSAARDTLIAWLHIVRLFLWALWMVKDNAVNCELGFLEQIDTRRGPGCTSNFIASLFSDSKGLQSKTVFSPAEIKEARRFYQDHIIPLITEPESASQDRRTTESDPIISSKDVPRLIRAQYFLSGARSNGDLGVKVALYMTSLEVLFATDATELAHKLSERVAWFVGRTPQERQKTYSLLKRAYGVRSRIIHGDILSAQAQRDLKEVSASVDSLIRDVFRRLFEDAESRAIFGKPSAEMEEYFAGLVLGAAGQV